MVLYCIVNIVDFEGSVYLRKRVAWSASWWEMKRA